MLADLKQILRALALLRFAELFSIRLFRMGLVGFTGFLTQAALFELLALQLALVRPSTAALIGAELAIIVAFFLHNRFTFPDRRLASGRQLLAKFPAFNLGVAGSLLIQWVTVRAAEYLVGDADMLLRAANVLGVCIGFASNYLVYTRIIWRKGEEVASEK